MYFKIIICFGFWLQIKKIGWLGILFQFVLAAIGNIYGTISYTISFFKYGDLEYLYGKEVQIGLFIGLILSVAFTVYIVYLISKRLIRIEIFNISDNQYFQYMFASVVFSLLLVYAFHLNSYYWTVVCSILEVVNFWVGTSWL